MTWNKEWQKGFWVFNDLVKLFTVKNRLKLGPELPTHTLILLIKVCQLFINYMCNATHHNPFGLRLNSVNEVCKHIFHIIDDLIFPFTKVYTIYCGSWLSYAEAKYQSSLWISPPPSCCYILYINTFTHNKMVTACYLLFPKLQLCAYKIFNIRDDKARLEIMISGSLSPQITKRILRRFDIGIKRRQF